MPIRAPYSVADLAARCARRKACRDRRRACEDTLRFEEYEALLRGMGERSGQDQFVCADVGELPDRITPWFAKASAAGDCVRCALFARSPGSCRRIRQTAAAGRRSRPNRLDGCPAWRCSAKASSSC